jgi:hypothetical protein
MKKDDFELLSVGEMRRKYGLTADNRPTIRLDPQRVPEPLRRLIPLAELWGVGDDLIRDDMVKKAPAAAIAELKRIVDQYDDLLDEWLAGPEAEGPTFTPEYTAFSAMRMAADFA